MALSSPASEASKLLEAALEQMDGIIQGAKFDIPQPRSKVSEALRNLHTCLLQDDADGQIANSDATSIEFIFNWLRNNLMFDPGYTGTKILFLHKVKLCECFFDEFLDRSRDRHLTTRLGLVTFLFTFNFI